MLQEKLIKKENQKIMPVSSIKAIYSDGEITTHNVYSQSMAYLVIEQLKNDRATNIICNFDELESLPKGVNLHDKY